MEAIFLGCFDVFFFSDFYGLFIREGEGHEILGGSATPFFHGARQRRVAQEKRERGEKINDEKCEKKVAALGNEEGKKRWDWRDGWGGNGVSRTGGKTDVDDGRKHTSKHSTARPIGMIDSVEKR